VLRLLPPVGGGFDANVAVARVAADLLGHGLSALEVAEVLTGAVGELLDTGMLGDPPPSKLVGEGRSWAHADMPCPPTSDHREG